MKKILIVLLGLFLVASSLEAQTRKTHRVKFKYENSNAWNHQVGDTLTGVAAGAASIDTITFSGVVNGKLASSILIAVNKDTSFRNTSNGKVDTTLLHVLRGVGGRYTSARDTLSLKGGLYTSLAGSGEFLGFVTNDFITEYIIDEGSFSGTDFRLLVDNTMVADTDSTSYTLSIVLVYDN